MFDWPLLSCTNRGLFCPQPAIIHDSASKIVAHQIVDSLSPQSQGTIYRNENTSVLINTLTKYIDWKYEHEWRIVEINDKQRNEVGYKIKFVKPKEIILGLKSNDFLWKINNTGKSSDEIKPDELIRYSEDILGTDCFQYQITTSDKGYKWEKIIRI